MAERFNTRDVKNKEIYDSYMGILRISPNEVKGTDIDDPTQILNTLYDEDKKERTKIILSDSDGNILPVNFQPRAFETTVIKRDPKSLVDTASQVDVLNLTTIIGKDDGSDSSFANSKLYVSNEFKCRSTLIIIRDSSETAGNYRKSHFRILSGGEPSISSKTITGRGWLLYPTESPNDGNYFNDKNVHELFDPKETSIPRYKQVEKSLFSWPRKKHELNINQDERVIVGDKLITEVNEYNEEVPIYYTRDYVLGHYDGHHTKNKNVSSQWGVNSSEGNTTYTTKLSWTRFDKLIWDALEEILTGNVRHIKGRYDELGVNEISGIGITDKLGISKSHEYKEYAPILGTEMPRGTIVYHAMPFHRYWYHRTRQALRGCIERRKIDLTLLSGHENTLDEKPANTTMDDFIVGKDLSLIRTSTGSGQYAQNTFHRKEVDKLQEFYKNKLITPCSMASVGFAHSLAKNFVLCNGRLLNFQNFPNISISNDQIFETGGVIGGVSQMNTQTKDFKHKSSWDNTVIGAIKASTNSSGAYAKLPNLFALFEKTPRFIRGLMWQSTKDDSATTVVYNELAATKSTYTSEDFTSSMQPHEIISKGDKTYTIANKKFLTSVDKPYFHTFDHLIEKEKHKHNLFTSLEGGTTGSNFKQLNYIHCSNTRGNNATYNRHYWHYGNFLNFDRTYSKSDLFAQHYTYYEFNSGDGWNDSGVYARYCMGDSDTTGANVYEGGFYEGYTPIPNMGLYLFNTSICNNKGAIGDKENKNENRGLHPHAATFIDAEGKWRSLWLHAPIDAPQSYDNESIMQYDEEKWRRKFYAMKLNEAEGFIPISCYGKASGFMVIAHSRDERSGSKSSSRNTYQDYIYNIGGYRLTQPKGTYSDDTSYWRCITSIAYLNPYKLGVGNISKYIENKKKNDETVDYYDINCVTQLPSQDTYRNYKFGGVNVEVDETCPEPPHMKLLPLIRI